MVNRRDFVNAPKTGYRVPSGYTISCTLSGEKAVMECVRSNGISQVKHTSVGVEKRYFRCQKMNCIFKAYILQTEDGNFDVYKFGQHNHALNCKRKLASGASAEIPKTKRIRQSKEELQDQSGEFIAMRLA